MAGKKIYGLLNDPNLNASIVPESVNGSTEWGKKSADQIYADILKLVSVLRQNSMGNINEDTPLVMALSPSSNSMLAKINTYGLSVRQMLTNEYGARLSFVELPELYSASGGSAVMLMAKDILGSPVAQLGFGEKYHACPMVRKLSSFEQKVVAGTYGAIIYYPFAIAAMEGV